MHLKLQELQRVAKQTIREEKTYEAIREELFRVLGPAVMVSSNIERVAEAANEQLDVLESTGKSLKGTVKLSTLLEASRSKITSVRKIAARLLPENLAARLIVDASSTVRCAAAKRLSYGLVKESVKKYPQDDQLRTIARAKKIAEAGLPKPKTVDEPFDMYGEEPLGDAVKTQPGEDMPDTWYERLAHKLTSEYGRNLEGQWEEILATRVSASYLATSGMKLDREKLLKAITKTIRDREDEVIGEGSLASLASRLLSESYLENAVMPVIEEEVNDPVVGLLEGRYSSSQYVAEAEKIFAVKKSRVPQGIKKYRIGEGLSGDTSFPVKASIPSGTSAVVAEKALDAYVSHWNKQQALSGEPFKLSWNYYPTDVNLVGFNLELK